MVEVFTDSERERLAGRARTLHERIERPPDQSDATAENADDWLDEWFDRVADGDAADFRDRLEREGVDSGECRRYLGSHAWPEGTPVPEWVNDLEEMLAFVDGTEVDPSTIDAVDEEIVPFAPVVSTFVAYARRTVDPAVPDELRAAFEPWLVERLKSLLSQTLFVEFKTFVALRDNEEDADVRDGGETVDETDPERERYEEFTTELLETGLRSFFLEYAYLGRLLVTTVEQWAEAVAEFRTRLNADRDELREAFGDGSPLGDVADLDVLGDRHRNGRAVVGVTFESGTKAAYKPRPIEVECAFSELLTWINARSELPRLETLDCLPRGNYGWTEWAAHKECVSDAEVARYYRRAGMLVCLLHATNFTDGHYENVVSKGEHPVLVDVETLAQPSLPAERTLWSEAMSAVMSGSVLRTSLLPSTVSDDDSWETSGFGAADVTFDEVTVPEFTDVNTDAMELEFDDSYSVSGENLPRKDGETQRASEYAEEIERGFEQTYEFLTDARADLLADNGPIAAFEGVEIRYLHRSTSTYASVRKSLRKPKYLRTGLKYGCKVDALAKPFVTGAISEDLWPVYECERAALARLDVPTFSMLTSGSNLRFDGDPIVDFCAETPLQRVRQRLRDLDCVDLDEQLAYLRLAFRDEVDDHSGADDTTPVTVEGTLSTDEIERTVRDIARRVVESSSRNGDGELAWYLRRRHSDGGVFLRKVDAGLYAGRTGIALFLAGSWRAFGERRHREFAETVVSPVRDRLRSDEDAPFAERGVGGGTGLGSVVYGLTTLGRLLDDDRYVADARRASELLAPDRIREDGTYDVVAGSAGAALSLLALYDETGNADVLDRAITCGDHLLASRVETDGGARVWHTVEDGRALTGFAHGTAGIAYALARLADAADEPQFADAAFEALDFEREHYDPERRNWADRRTDTASRFADAWCYGRSGVGLARLGTYEVEATDRVREDAERARRGLDAQTLKRDDHLCCGNFGRVEFALKAARTLGREEDERRARRLATAAVRRAGSGRFSVGSPGEHWYDPTLFRGEAGIGYELLRLASPDLPSVLLWE